MNSKSLIITILVALLVGGVGFFGGVKYQQSKEPKFVGQMSRNGNFNSNGNRTGDVYQRRFNGPQGQGMVVGEIISSDAKSITVKLPDGSSKIVILSDTSSINKAVECVRDDLIVGENVKVFGSTNSDGSVTAQNIQINPAQNNNTN
ncbi:hypothetical protein A2V49_02820 [candidate division WWE3 bacterium RBG_19FT_COMBO_34_6]|uniref:DUF5666 domain-containing protein n=1 Tax=candidate division WWE3 bacterium RBG_19FT_COMBO_34_6 TaxID=1802612 RepID=A0A1F4UN77_UNCKA|nr:MAG: hypothetical protein A2V49_02820 [candidate division WWE3 bacterium RBG_19FT_COMBO_34_6]